MRYRLLELAAPDINVTKRKKKPITGEIKEDKAWDFSFLFV